MEILLAVEDEPKKSFLLLALSVLHDRLVALPSRQRHGLITQLFLSDPQQYIFPPGVIFVDWRSGLDLVLRLRMHARQFGVIDILVNHFVISHYSR